MKKLTRIGVLAGISTAIAAMAGCGGSGTGPIGNLFGGLVFLNGASVETMNTDGSNVQLVSPDGFVSSMSFARKVVTSITVGGNEDVYSINADGSGQTRLTTDPADDFRPIISPDGSLIVFISRRDGNDEVYVMNGDGSGQTRLTNNPASDYFPCISANGSKVIFTSNRDGNDEIYSMNIDGTGLARLTNDAGSDTTPAWSPDGSHILFSSNRDGNYEIYSANADGTGVVRLTNLAGDQFHASYNTDGTAIYYEDNAGVSRMNPDGTGQAQLQGGPTISKCCTWVYEN